MNRDLWRYLPSEIVIGILLRLSVRNIAICKCVCKSWRDSIKSDDFLKLGFSESGPALVVMDEDGSDSNLLCVFKLDDTIPLSASNWFNFSKLEAKHKHDPITKFDFPRETSIIGSANGLLLLGHNIFSDDHLYVCNPITREFAELYGPPSPRCLVNYGLGVSKISGQYKVVLLNPIYGCYVLTLEKGSSWRHVTFSFDHTHGGHFTFGSFVNGNLYWLVTKGEETPFFCCFDVETEHFSTFPGQLNSMHSERRDYSDCHLYSVGDSLCFCDDEPYDNEIWEYEQVEKRWSKLPFIMEQPYQGEFSMFSNPQPKVGNLHFQPIKVYKNGDMLMLWEGMRFLYYSYKWRSVREIGLFDIKDNSWYFETFLLNSILLTPTLLSLKKNLGMENVISF